MADAFADHRSALDSPATKHWLLTADTEADVSPRPRAIHCEVAGTITIRDEHGTELSYAMAAGDQRPFRAARITAIASGTFYGWS